MCLSSDALRVLGVRVVRFRGPQNISIAFINRNHGATGLRFDVLPRVFLQLPPRCCQKDPVLLLGHSPGPFRYKDFSQHETVTLLFAKAGVKLP